MLASEKRSEKRQDESAAFQKMLRSNITLPIALILVLCAVYIAQLMYLLRANKEVERSDRVIAEITETLKLMLDAETGMRGFLLMRKELFLESYDLAIRRLPENLNSVESLVKDRPAQLETLTRTFATFDTWKALAEKRIEGARNGKSPTLEDSIQGKQMMDGIRGSVQNMLTTELRRRDDHSREAESSTRMVLLLTLGGGLFVGALLAFSGRRQLFSLAGTYESSLRHQREQNAVLERQAWLRTGQSDLLARLRGDISEEEVGQRILAFLTNFLGAELGALYSRAPRERTFHRLAASGLDQHALEARRSFSWGEGLPGKVAESQEIQVLDKLPAGYLDVRSGLGGTQAGAVVLVPFRAHGDTTAVLELGYLHATDTGKAREFLELISESVGTILQSSFLRSRQKALFEETQQLNEELQAQQEELRVSNEELEQQATILKESQARLETQQTELEESNRKLETQAAQLEEKARELGAASQYKSEFLANMSHELRTPLNSSLILAKLLADNPQGNLSAEQVEFADTIYSAGNDLLALINDILDLAKVEAGRLELHPEVIHLPAVVEALRKTFQPLAGKKGLTLEVSLRTEARPETDRMRLEQILRNLLSNAVKFTEKGKVRLEVEQVGQRLRFAVTDTGIGIPLKHQQNIFEAFRQADGTTNRKYGGTGLGLSISRELAHLLGGSVSVQSRPGEGSRFEVELPLSLPAASMQPSPSWRQASLPPAAPPPLSRADSSAPPSVPAMVMPARLALDDDRLSLDGERRLVLAIEDEPAFAKALYQLAQELGFQCMVASSAAEGLDLARRHLPSAIILDVALPDQTGMAVLDSLKEDLKTRHIPVHVISGHDYTQAAMEMGAVGYMLKPVRKEELTQAFRTLEAKFSQTLKRVLIVEDDDTQRKSIASLISGKGVEASHAATGEAALRQLKEQKFDCVILDLRLPDMTGFELLEKMSAEGNAFPPVIVYTGRDLTGEEEARLRRHSNSIIVKGARSPERLLDEVSLFLHQVESELPPEKRKMIQSLKNRDRLLEGKTILLVDDDARNLFALMHVLEPRGAKVEVARNGKEALASLKNLSRVDLVLMDIMMPEMDGYEAMREIRRNPETAKLPVIAVTAKAMSSDYEKCLAAGANDYLAKPLDVGRLLSLLKVWIQRGAAGQ